MPKRPDKIIKADPEPLGNGKSPESPHGAGETGAGFKPRDLLVVKFGGKTLEDPARVGRLANTVLTMAQDHDIIVVVSAMGDQTSQLIQTGTQAALGHPDPQDLIAIAAQGEITSAHVFKAALTAQGGRAAAIVPGDPRWPIVVQEQGSKALASTKVNQQLTVKLEEPVSRERARTGLQRLVAEGVIPVVTGFLAETVGGRLTTLGRGGSDITAFMLAKLCAAQQVIIVTDTPGILKADPKLVGPTAHVQHLTIEEIDSIAKAGAQVLHPKSLEYKTDKFKARVVHYDEPDYPTGGTEISGFYRALLRGNNENLAMVAMVGVDLLNSPRVLGDLGILAKRATLPLYGISLTEGFLAFYVSNDRGEEVCRILSDHLEDWPYVKSIILRKGVARLNIASHKFIDTPGVLEQIVRPLAEEGINVLEVITNQSDITLFVDWADRHKTWTILKRLATDVNMEDIFQG
ncbi:MAG TPA: ACT domain-containing protein [bacterium]|nr:ACT domain-containing protein [bacterium]